MSFTKQIRNNRLHTATVNSVVGRHATQWRTANNYMAAFIKEFQIFIAYVWYSSLLVYQIFGYFKVVKYAKCDILYNNERTSGDYRQHPRARTSSGRLFERLKLTGEQTVGHYLSNLSEEQQHHANMLAHDLYNPDKLLASTAAIIPVAAHQKLPI